MARKLKVLGIIPARGGSKGIKNKNIVLVDGKPLISYTLQAVKESELLTRCIVSSDSIEILEICKAAGADIPFVRPTELAGDKTPTLPVIQHALEQLDEEYEAVMILQPTSPLRNGDDIDAAINLLAKDALADSVISVCKVGDNHPARMKEIVNGVLTDPPFAEESEGQRRQDLPPLYLRNGAIYLTRTETIISHHTFKGKRSLAYIMPDERSVNIDSSLDLLLFEALLKNRKGVGKY